jgi:DNA-binding NtrC family response regulator
MRCVAPTVQSRNLVGRTILVVEDEPLIALDIVAAFEKSGADVVTARSLARARRLVEQDGLSAAVLDFGLSDGDADALFARLASRDIPYVLHSGYADRSLTCGRGLVYQSECVDRGYSGDVRSTQ